MEHMSRERISFQERLAMIRENYGPVSMDRGYITVCSYSWMLTVSADSVIQCMGLNDFKKMLRCVKNQLDPDYFYEYLHIWEGQIDRKIPTAIGESIPPRLHGRYVKMSDIIRKEMDRLPGYVYEE